MTSDRETMRVALEQAREGAAEGEVPVGAVAIYDGRIIAATHNTPVSRCDPTAHAEILALRAAAAHLGTYRLEGLELFVTLEPCLMCFGALLHARIRRLAYGASDPKVGFSRLFPRLLESALFNHKFDIEGGLLADECSALLHGFFRQRR